MPIVLFAVTIITARVNAAVRSKYIFFPCLAEKKVDRLAILVSSGLEEQLLGIPKLPNGTGAAEASHVVDSLYEWEIAEEVCAMSFDSTSTNTGCVKGACVLIEQKLARELLWLACRHHVYELVLESAFVSSMGDSKDPDIHPIFKRFKRGVHNS